MRVEQTQLIYLATTSVRHQTIAAAALLVFLCLTPTAVIAQSGRRLPNSKPVAAPTPEPTPTPAAEKEKPKPAYSVLVGIDSDSFLGIPLQYYSVAVEACAARIEASSSVQVAGQQTRVSRSEAIRRAKAEKETYVVWLQLRDDSMGADRGASSSSEIVLEYLLLAPGTAKQVTAGRTYQSATRRGGVIVNPRTTGRGTIYGEHLIKEAAREAGERILSALTLPTGKTLPP